MAQTEKEISGENKLFKPQIEKATIIHKNERKKISIPGNPIHYQKITPKGTQSMAMYTVIAEPGQSTGTKLLHHGGDECLLVLSGTFELELEDRKERLGPGDSAFIPRGQTHRLTNSSNETGECVFVLSPPEYTVGEH